MALKNIRVDLGYNQILITFPDPDMVDPVAKKIIIPALEAVTGKKHIELPPGDGDSERRNMN